MAIKWKSFLLLLISLLIMGLGINIVTHANLGTTAITSPPYVISLFSSLSFGTLTMVFNVIYIIIQIALLRKDFSKIQYLQFVITFVLGISIDFWRPIIANLPNQGIVLQILMALLGSFIIAFSTILQLDADLVNNPAEGIVKAISIKSSWSFGRVKVIYDITLVVLAVIISFMTMNGLYGVGLGTLITAFTTGYFITFIKQLMEKV